MAARSVSKQRQSGPHRTFALKVVTPRAVNSAAPSFLKQAPVSSLFLLNASAAGI